MWSDIAARFSGLNAGAISSLEEWKFVFVPRQLTSTHYMTFYSQGPIDGLSYT